MKGRKIRSRSNPGLAQSFAPGATFTVILPTLHQTYGVINLVWPRYWPDHLRTSRAAYLRLVRLDKALLEIPVDQANQRMVQDARLRDNLYRAGVELITNLVLTLQYLTLEIERIARHAGDPTEELTSRLRGAMTRIGFGDPKDEAGWDALVAVHKYRDAVMHPTEANTYGTRDGSWATVPLAWFASGRAIASSASALELTRKMAVYWESRKAAYNEPRTITLSRGIESLEQVKKPPGRSTRHQKRR